MAAHLAVLGGWDFSAYVRVGADDGLNPYAPTIEEPAFSDASLGEGQPLVAINVKNREGVYPLYLGSATSPLSKDQLHALQRTAAAACLNAKDGDGALEWRDAGASNSTFYDVTYARFEPAFHYRRSQKGWLAGVLRIFSAPPFGHTGSWALQAGGSAAGTGITITLPLTPTIGDAPALLKVQITLGTYMVDREEGRLVGMTVVPSGRPVVYTAASLPKLMANPTVINDAFVAGTKALARQRTGMGPAAPDIYTRVDMAPASQFVGRQRMIILGRRRTVASADPIWRGLDDNSKPLGPDCSATAYWGYAAYDLGVLNVQPASGQATVSAFVFGADDQVLDRILILPEDSTAYVMDRSAPLLAYDTLPAGRVSFLDTTDDIGNAYASTGNTASWGALEGSLPSGQGMGRPSVGSYSGADLKLNHPSTRDIRVSAYVAAPEPTGMAMLGKSVSGVTFVARFMRADPTTISLSLAMIGAGDITSVASVMASISALATINQSFLLDFRSVGPQARARLLSGGSLIASLGASNILIRGDGVTYLGGAASSQQWGGGAIGFVTVLALPSAPLGPQDIYALGPEEVVHYASTGVFQRRLDEYQRSLWPVASGAGAQQVVAFNLPLGGAPTNDFIAANVRIRERFTFAR